MTKPDTILVVALEASGDRLAADVLSELRRRNPGLRAVGIGGPALAALGMRSLVDLSRLSVMGVTDVLPSLGRFQRLMMRLTRLGEHHGVRRALLVDSPDFNLPLAHRLRRRGIDNHMLVAPQAWAWRPGRARAMARDVLHLYVLFPFEVAFFRRAGVRTTFVGHPLAVPPPPSGRRDALVLLPGSRRAEVARHLPVMLRAAPSAARAANVETVLVSCADTIEPDRLRKLCDGQARVAGPAHEVLPRAKLAIAVSGTVTLQAALTHTPTIIVYRTDRLTYTVARALVRTPYIGMPNLLAGTAVFPELLQNEVTEVRLLEAVRALLATPGSAQSAAFRDLRRVLQSPEPGGMAGMVADRMD